MRPAAEAGTAQHLRWVHWQNGDSYRDLLDIDRAGLMWEWLRRDRDYIAWHAKASRVTRVPADTCCKWGLHFCREP